MIKKILFLLILHICSAQLFAQLRSFDAVFPGIAADVKTSVFSNTGYIKTSEKSKGLVIVGKNSSVINSNVISNVLGKNPGYVAESISVIPARPGEVSILNIYNALGNIRDLKGRLYPSATRNQEIPLFEEATRIKSEKQTTAIPDPAPASAVPGSETVYLKLKDVNFGNSFYRAEVALLQNGLRYGMSNFKNITYFLIPVIKEGNFIAQLYFEPIEEGILVYSIAGADVSDFLASKIDMGSAISKRLTVIISWAKDGISRTKR